MNSPSFDGLVKEIEKSLDQIADAVLERGYDHIPEEFDDYSLMMGEFEYQKVITFQLYENYFLPKRHEFELELISKIVAGIGKSQTAVFLSSAILAGIVGNASYALVR